MENRILVVDDDGQLTAFLQRFLSKHGFDTDIAGTAAEARALLANNTYNLVVLDLILPDTDGLEIAGEIRHDSGTPVIMLTARDELYDRIVGLEVGADDYITKPYEPHELLARIRSVLRRSSINETQDSPDEPQSIRFVGLELNLAQRHLTDLARKQIVPLTSTEFTLLHTLVKNAGSVLSREMIMDVLYGNAVTVTDRAIDAHITRLRRKIDPEDQTISLIRAVHGKGYIFAAELD
ncbi:response regulator transcription factor [Roseovarius sp. 2305UL8-3]|uniref:response regulator transcription factor n=1 Tax=Roseovarius conchicola TaxID=3121636 RepID=UPI003527B9B4